MGLLVRNGRPEDELRSSLVLRVDPLLRTVSVASTRGMRQVGDRYVIERGAFSETSARASIDAFEVFG